MDEYLVGAGAALGLVAVGLLLAGRFAEGIGCAVLAFLLCAAAALIHDDAQRRRRP